MAFLNADLIDVGVGGVGNSIYVYESDSDTRETVMASGYFNNDDDDLNMAADDRIYVNGDEGFYTLRVDAVSAAGVVTTEIADGSTYILSTQLASIAASTSGWLVSPCDGLISRMWGVIHGTISDDTTMGLEIDNTNVTDGSAAAILTFESSASAAGDVATGTADAANVVTEGQAIEVTSGAESSTAVAVDVFVEVIAA